MRRGSSGARHPSSLPLASLWSYSYVHPFGRRVLTPGLISHLDSLRPVLRHEPRLWRATCRKLVFHLFRSRMQQLQESVVHWVYPAARM